MYVIVRPCHVPLRCAFGGRKIWACAYYLHTKKTHTHFSHCSTLSPHKDAAPHIHQTTQKTPQPFGRGADIIANNINYFSSLIACFIYALFASLAALFASRLTFK